MDLLLDGSVQPAANKVRVSLQLLDLHTTVSRRAVTLQVIQATSVPHGPLHVSFSSVECTNADAHDPEKPVADDGRNVSSSAILLIGGIKPLIAAGGAYCLGNVRQNSR
ncbi:hypothetical protein [Acidisphaera sp. S103]|uniref:hypothetical protein n=1 Tax=Acidisphaera sp. S103 TaxID=1747223 RepID=UPI00131BEA58|nr:hypothetical protein [Acidisphaera sp. S103]